MSDGNVKMAVGRGKPSPEAKEFSDVTMNSILMLTPRVVHHHFSQDLRLTSKERVYIAALFDAQQTLFEDEET